MPVYEYRCLKCSKEFEYQQRMSDPPMAVCEACGGELERLISRTAFQLKGGGWYKDLYSSSKPETKSTESASSEAKPAESTKSDKPSGGGDSGGGTGAGSGSGTGSGTGSGGGGTSASSAAA